MKAAFYTLGCKVNQYETQIMEQRLAQAGYEIVGSGEPADVYIVNSCTVTGESDRKTRQALRRLRAQNPAAVTVLSGCFPQSSPDKAASFTEADVVTGVLGRTRIDELIAQARSTGRRVVAIDGFSRGEAFEPMRAAGFEGHTRAFIKIEDGCASYCSYCIIPYSRGPVRSKPPEEIKDEAAELAAKGYREIVLVGINLSSYGTDLGGQARSAGLCGAAEAAASAPGVGRIRLGSLEPNVVTPEFLARMKSCEKLCPQFHLSLQSGCAATLRRMKRRYTPDSYLAAINALRGCFPSCGITTDIIVGFPGETPDEFAQSLAFAEIAGFSQGHVFPYSRRGGTPAASMPNQIPRAEKERRAKLMSQVCAQSRAKFLAGLTGSVQSVLFEESKDGFITGFAPNYAQVRVRGGAELHGVTADVRITGSDGSVCSGELTG